MLVAYEAKTARTRERDAKDASGLTVRIRTDAYRVDLAHESWVWGPRDLSSA